MGNPDLPDLLTRLMWEDSSSGSESDWSDAAEDDCDYLYSNARLVKILRMFIVNRKPRYLVKWKCDRGDDELHGDIKTNVQTNLQCFMAPKMYKE